MSVETIVAAAAVAIALLALVVSMWQASLQRQHNRLSVRPHLRVDITVDGLGENRQKVTAVMANSGLGPAFLLQCAWTLDGRVLSGGWVEVCRAILEVLPFETDEVELYTPYPGDPMSPGEKLALLEGLIARDQDFDELKKRLTRVGIAVRYRSIYDEDWMFSTDLGRDA